MTVPKEIICLGCPNGCHMTCEQHADGSVTVTGHQCERGEDYASEELLDPKRVVTAVVALDDGPIPFAPVKTDKPIPVTKIHSLLKTLYRARATPPIRCGDMLIRDFSGTGVNVTFTRTIPADTTKNNNPGSG